MTAKKTVKHVTWKSYNVAEATLEGGSVEDVVRINDKVQADPNSPKKRLVEFDLTVRIPNEKEFKSIGLFDQFNDAHKAADSWIWKTFGRLKEKPFRWSQGMGRDRVYFYDADTGEELKEGSFNGNFEAGIWKNARWSDTRIGFIIVDPVDKMRKEIDASDFPGRRVLVKVWYGATKLSDWFALVDLARGWKGNEADTGKLERKELGVSAMVAKMYAIKKKK